MRRPRFLLASLLLALNTGVWAQAFPTKSIRLIVPYPAGGVVDTAARAVGKKLADVLGQAVIVENQPGANATIGLVTVAKSPPDGHTIGLTSMVHYMVPFFSKNMPYDTLRDFTPIAPIAVVNDIVAVNPSVPVKTIQELIDHGRQSKTPLFYGTPGVGGSQHLGGLLLAQSTGLNLDHVPYKGGSIALADALGGQVPMVILAAPSVLPHLKTGKLRALGVIQDKRMRSAPDIPTVSETISGFAVPPLWIGILGPAGLPKAVSERLNQALRQAMRAPEVRQALEDRGYDMVAEVGVDEFLGSIKSDVEVIRKIVTTARIQPE
jgi:tripartite-type tricarboxylate transporter receptor subunit TctC